MGGGRGFMKGGVVNELWAGLWEGGCGKGAGLKGGWAGLGGIIETPQGEPERNHRDDIERPQHHTKSPTERTAVEDLIANTPEKP